VRNGIRGGVVCFADGYGILATRNRIGLNLSPCRPDGTLITARQQGRKNFMAQVSEELDMPITATP